jgi:pyruvate/2-oxoacid:ferredoxin oxidoreductase alpha subunit
LGTQQNDSLSLRDAGWLQFYCESAQELLDLVLIGYRVAEEVKLPLVVAGDGFYLSHEREEVWVPTAEAAEAFVGPPRFGLLPRGDEPMAFGGVAPPPKYFEGLRRMHHDLERAQSVFESVAAEYERTFGRRYSLVEPFHTEDAEWVFLTAGTIGGTAREVVECLRAEGIAIGQIKLQVFRPFPAQALREALRRSDGSFAPHLLVLDRNLAPGHGGIFAGEARLALSLQDVPTRVHSFIAGLGGLDVTPEMVEQAWRYVREHPDERRPTLFLTESGVEG